MANCRQKNDHHSKKEVISEVNLFMDNWHEAAAKADFGNYFGKMDSISVFIGTDASENWNKKQFIAFSKPYFDTGKAWSFTAMERNIYMNDDKDIVWFDELLNTWMGTCRGSGVLENKNNAWKIKHYVLSIAIPNDDVRQVMAVKRKRDSAFRVNHTKLK